MRAALGLDEPSFGPAPAIEQGESPDTFLISARDLLPLRLCTFAPLRSFLPTAGISARDPLPLRLCTFAPLRSFLPAAGISSRDPLFPKIFTPGFPPGQTAGPQSMVRFPRTLSTP
jgi:hypothetical protein